MRLGRVKINREYIVDLDNQEMVDHAKESVCEDFSEMLKSDTVYDSVIVEPAPDASENDIPDFLTDDIY